jgi:hypothetical protein
MRMCDSLLNEIQRMTEVKKEAKKRADGFKQEANRQKKEMLNELKERQQEML